MSKRTTEQQFSYFVSLYEYISQKTNYTSMLQDLFDEEIIPVAKNVLQDGKLTILSIGAGAGTPDLILLKCLNSFAASRHQIIQVFFTAFEPLGEPMEEFKKRLTTVSQELNNIKLSADLRQSKVDEFLIQESSKFDIVLLIHSIYFMDAMKVLQDCYEVVSPHGCMAIQIAGERQLLNIIASFVKDLGLDSEACKLAQAPQGGIRKDSLVNFLESKQWQFVTKSKDYNVDLTEAYDSSSVNGAKIIEFFCHAPNLKEEIGNDAWKLLLKAIESCLYKEAEVQWRATLKDELLLVLK